MPENKRESIIFTTLMCAFMVYFMTVYNIIRVQGFTPEVFVIAWLGFPLAYVFALLSDLLIVGPNAKKLAFKILRHNRKTWKIPLTISTCMVSGMVILMSLFGAIHSVGMSSKTMQVWLSNIPANFIIALPLQLLIAGPLVRFVFRKAFPKEIITQ